MCCLMSRALTDVNEAKVCRDGVCSAGQRANDTEVRHDTIECSQDVGGLDRVGCCERYPVSRNSEAKAIATRHRGCGDVLGRRDVDGDAVAGYCHDGRVVYTDVFGRWIEGCSSKIVEGGGGRLQMSIRIGEVSETHAKAMSGL